MDELIPSMHILLDRFHVCFRAEVFCMFRLMVGSWLVCLGRRNISRVWETTGQAGQRNHAAAYRLFSAAAWDWDEVGCVLCTLIITYLIPGAVLWLVVDDTLCHKRGAKVAFGGIFLDAVLSTKKHKVFRFGNNWVMLGIVVQLPFRKDRYFCLPVLWRVYEKRGKKKAKDHRTKGQLAAEMVALLAAEFPLKKVIVVGDCAYVGQHLLRDRRDNVEVVGPIRWDAALFAPSDAESKQKKGKRLPTPKAMLADDNKWPWQELTLVLGSVERELTVKVIDNVCWYHAAGSAPVRIVLVRDRQGQWRDEALLCTDVSLSAAAVIRGYCRRWSVEVAFADAKQRLGFHDPQVYCEASVKRAAPMSWFVGSLVVLWYVVAGSEGSQAQRERPWYKNKPEPTFADMLAACRLQHWEHWLDVNSASEAELMAKWAWLLNYIATAT